MPGTRGPQSRGQILDFSSKRCERSQSHEPEVADFAAAKRAQNRRKSNLRM
jgi:hypothetical protein